MDSHYIHAQALTLMKSYEEQIGPFNDVAVLIKLYGHGDPHVAFSDDPTKVSSLLSMLKTLTRR